MSEIDTARMRQIYLRPNLIYPVKITHSDECVYWHVHCAITALCDALDAARERIKELETVQAIRAGRMESALTDIRVCIEQGLHGPAYDGNRLRIIDGLAAEGLEWREDESEVGPKGE